MKINKLQLLSLSGILGSVLMFSGDMLLYYEPISGLDYNSTARMGTMPWKPAMDALIHTYSAHPVKWFSKKFYSLSFWCHHIWRMDKFVFHVIL